LGKNPKRLLKIKEWYKTRTTAPQRGTCSKNTERHISIRRDAVKLN
jgi:hypothetical protein